MWKVSRISSGNAEHFCLFQTGVPRRRYPRTSVRGLHPTSCGQLVYLARERLGVERVGILFSSLAVLGHFMGAAAFVDDTMEAEISLASRTLNNGGASFVWSNIRGRVLYHNSRLEPFHGEQNSTITQDQCVFIRGFRVKDDKMQVIRVSCVPEEDDSNIGVVDAIQASHQK
ncbi:hypothetical protein BGY98DRAFT_716952 [Russula aff. rugulosa BPL654]|nr:hypothetical protein BGY98DRAFT_716952 [Russula aff. rugulosa BPL654]